MNNIPVKKRLFICLAISLVLIIAGAFLLGFLGFNPDRDTKDRVSLQVTDNGYMAIDPDFRDSLRSFCENKISEGGFSVTDVAYASESSGGSGSLEFVLDGASEEKLASFVGELDAALSSAQYGEGTENTGTYKELSAVSVTYHISGYALHTEVIWRAAVAAAVAAVLLFAYVAIRFKVGMGVTALVAAVHDVLLTLGVIALVRIPAGMSLVCVAVFALLLSVFLNLKVFGKMRKDLLLEDRKELSAEQAVALSVKESRKGIFVADILVASAVVILAIAGLFVGFDMFSFMLGALVAILVANYSALVLSPAIYTLIKEKSDANRAKRVKYNYASEKAKKKNAKSEDKVPAAETGEAQS